MIFNDILREIVCGGIGDRVKDLEYILCMHRYALERLMFIVYNIFLVLLRFEALVERECLQAGHPFNDRCGNSAFAVTKNRHESPVFLLFLDCVWQVMYNNNADIGQLYTTHYVQLFNESI